MKLRIVLSTLVVLLIASCQAEDISSTSKAITSPYPCAVWVDRTQAMAEMRADTFPLRPDAVFFTLGTTTCVESFWYCNSRPIWDTFYQGCVVRSIQAPGTTTANGIGTSPSVPGENSTSPSDLLR